MPVIFRWRGHSFFFFSNEGDPREPLHIHIRKGERLAKFWITSQVSLAESYSFSSKELRCLAKIIENRKKEIVRRWNEHFSV